ncbi:MAG: hypothetical protein ABI878_03925 [Acidobacteriota bacterium]
MSIFSIFKRKQKFDPAARRIYLLRNGRITDGVIIDSETTRAGEEIVFYAYTLNGVDFESSELLTPEQKADPVGYAPGAKVAIRYDPKNQGNSILE